MGEAAKRLPSLAYGRILFDHFAKSIHPSLGILHVPSTRDLMERAYQRLEQGFQAPTSAELLLLFSIFAGASVICSPHPLGKMPGPANESIEGDFAAYCRVAMALLDSTRPMPACTAVRQPLFSPCILLPTSSASLECKS